MRAHVEKWTYWAGTSLAYVSFWMGQFDLLIMLDPALWDPLWDIVGNIYCCKRGLHSPIMNKIPTSEIFYVSEIEVVGRLCGRWHLVIFQNAKVFILFEIDESK